MTTLKTFDDLSDSEKLQLTDEQIEHYVDVELMSKGLVRPTAPTLKDVPDADRPEGELMFVVQADDSDFCAFESIDDARTMIELSCLKVDYDWLGSGSYGSSDKLEYVGDAIKFSIVERSLSTKVDADRARKALKGRAAVIKQNADVQDEYNEASSEVRSARESIDEDICQLQTSERTYSRLLDRFDHFVGLAGDHAIALKFMLEGECELSDLEAAVESISASTRDVDGLAAAISNLQTMRKEAVRIDSDSTDSPDQDDLTRSPDGE